MCNNVNRKNKIEDIYNKLSNNFYKLKVITSKYKTLMMFLFMFLNMN